MHWGEINVPAPVALAVTANSLFGKCTHDRTPLFLVILLKQRGQSSKRINSLIFIVAG